MSNIDTRNLITWLASYPKSGNTWVRFMLLNLMYGHQETTGKLESLIPDIHKCKGELRLPAHPVKLVKTHFLLNPEMPFLGHSSSCIYIVRNPIDVMFSNLNYVYIKLGVEDDQEIRNRIKVQYINQFIDNCGDHTWIQLGRGSWIDHVNSWIESSLMPRLLVKYEDLLSAPVRELQRITSFLELEKSLPELQTAVDHSSFNRMKAIEDHEIANKKAGFFLDETVDDSFRKGNRFMFRGTTGEGKKELSNSQMIRFLEQFGPTIEKLGYQSDPSV